MRWLGEFAGKPHTALEIGSFEGRSTLWLCENILTAEDARIDCLDLFATDPVHGDYLSRFRHNTSEHTWKVREVHGPSFEGLRQVEGPYDIVYVDGWHSAFGALADGVMSWPMLKVGGVMVFDDYLWVPPKYGEPPVPGALARFWASLRGREWAGVAQCPDKRSGPAPVSSGRDSARKSSPRMAPARAAGERKAACGQPPHRKEVDMPRRPAPQDPHP